MNEKRANDRDTTDMSETPEQQNMFDAGGHLTNSALNESLDGTLAGRSRDLAQGHLANCAACASRRDELARTVALMRSLHAVEPTRSFEITAALEGSAGPSKPRFLGLLTPAFPALRVAVAAVLLLLVGVTTADIVTQRDDQGDQVAMVSETPAARTGSVSMQQAPPADPAPAAPAANIEAAEAEDSTLAAPSESFDEAVADDDSAGLDQEESAGDGDIAIEQVIATPQPEPTATVEPPQDRQDAADGNDGLSNWRIAEISLLLLLFWLVVTWFGLERLRKR